MGNETKVKKYSGVTGSANVGYFADGDNGKKTWPKLDEYLGNTEYIEGTPQQNPQESQAESGEVAGTGELIRSTQPNPADNNGTGNGETTLSEVKEEYDDAGKSITIDLPTASLKPGHSTGTPYPNVVRIEVLTPEMRYKYLTGGVGKGMLSLQSELELMRSAVVESLGSNDYYKPFYGICDYENVDLCVNLTAGWSGTKKNSSIIDAAKAIKTASEAVGDVGNGVRGMGARIAGFNGGKSKALKGVALAMAAIGTAAGWAAGAAGSGAKAIGGLMGKMPSMAEGILQDVGVSINHAGAASLKRYSGTTITPPPSITCKWYMPEQGNLARLSIQRLLHMSYMRAFRDNSAQAMATLVSYAAGANKKALAKAMSNNNENRAVVKANNDDNALVSKAKEWVDKGAGKIDDVAAGVQSVLSKLEEAGGKALGSTIMSYLGASEGFALTMDPLPVRLTVGHVLDMAPLVITSVKLSCSKEQFISPDGSHIPLFITATIAFDTWLNPLPQHDFLEIMGDQVFGQQDK